MAVKRARVIKMRLDELAAVDVGAQEAQGTVVLKRGRETPPPTETKKRSAITTAVLGHTHLVTGIDEMQAGCTTSERVHDANVHVDSYASYHSHPWVRGEDGSIVLGEAAGHTHQIATSAAALAIADANKSTQATPAIKVDPMTTKLVVLSEAQKAHYDTLTGADAEAFVAKSSLERDAEVEKARASDPVVFTGTITGIEVRKSQGDAFRKLAESNERNAEAAKKATESAEAEKAAREAETYKARAKAELGYLVGSDAVKAKVLQSIDGRIIAYTAEERDEALRMLKGADEIAKSQTHAPGYNPGDARETDALAEFNAGVAKYAEKNDIKDQGLALERFLGTTEGLALKKKYDATRAYGQQPGGR